jgi:drug/metabolite transporter (DMT)-like permease
VVIQPEVAAVVFGLAASASWGMGDFAGGVASRRSAVLGVVAVAHMIGFVIYLVLATLSGEPFPATGDLAWGMIAGLMGVFGLAAFYRALATGRMGIAAPLTAILAAILPVVVGVAAHGIPAWNQTLGIFLGIVSVGLISYSGGGTADRGVLGLVVVAGIGFGGFLVLIDRVSPTAVLWPLVAARLASSLATFALVKSNARIELPQGRGLLLMVLGVGVLDAFGNIFFVMARQGGRLDIAGVVASLYPAVTILMARLVLKEHMARIQILGVVVALTAIALIAGG